MHNRKYCLCEKEMVEVLGLTRIEACASCADVKTGRRGFAGIGCPANDEVSAV